MSERPSSIRPTVAAPPHPDRARFGLAAITGFMALQAWYGAFLLLNSPEGLPSPPAFLPGDDWTWGAVALVALIGLPMAVGCVLQAVAHPRADDVCLAAGVVLVGWAVVQPFLIGQFSWLQPFCLVVGGVVAAWAWRRRSRRSSAAV
jgi:hypothetical protein